MGNDMLGKVALGLGIGSLVAFFGSFVPYLGVICCMLYWPSALAAIIVGIVAMVQSKNYGGEGKQNGMIGLIMGASTVAIYVVLIFVIFLLYGGLIFISLLGQ
jgi:dolichyl-phosphate-mannose--protein O-mannosyl transferase